MRRSRRLLHSYRPTAGGVASAARPNAGRHSHRLARRRRRRHPHGGEGHSPNDGDRNGDGLADSNQYGVRALPDPSGTSYVTVEVSGGCSELLDVHVMAEAEVGAPDPSFDYPLGLVSFMAPCSSAAVRIYFHATASLAPPYRKFGPTVPGDPASSDWYTLPGATFGTAAVGAQTVGTVAFALVDGALGDATSVDGMIVDPGGPGVRTPPMQLPALGPFGLALLAGALAGLGSGRVRKRDRRSRERPA